jgi:LysR family glycine cleavage system transcriptional activator
MIGIPNSRQNWESLRIFAACAQFQSFSRAAEQLGVTQAAVSQRIGQLERRMGVQLFFRRPRLALTPAGAALAPPLVQAFASINRAIADLRGLSGITVTTTPTIAVLWLLPRLSRFHHIARDTPISLDVTDDLRSLDDDHYDLAIRAGHGKWPGLHSEELFPIELTPMLSPRLAGTKGPISIDRLTRLPVLSDPAWPQWFRTHGAAVPRALRRHRVSVNSQQLAAELVLAGEAVALMSPRLFRSPLSRQLLIQPFRTVTTFGTYYVLCRPDRAREPGIEKLRQWLRGEVSSDTTKQQADVEPLIKHLLEGARSMHEHRSPR